MFLSSPPTYRRENKQTEMTEQKENLYEAFNQWISRPADERFETLDQLAEKVSARRMRSRARDVFAEKVAVETDSDGRLLINSEIEPSMPSHWAFGQLASQIKAPAAYLRTLPPDLVVRNINHGLANNTAKDQLKFMTIQPESDGPSTLQAINGVGYGRIWDADCVKAVQRIVDASGGKFHNPVAFDPYGGSPKPQGLYASDHDVFMFMIDGGSFLEGGDRAKLHRGFIVWNSETGARTLGAMTFFHNGVCGNHIIWGASDVNKLIIRHTSSGPERFANEVMPTLKGYVESSPTTELAIIRKAQEMLLPWKAGLTGDDLTKAAVDFGRSHNLSRPEMVGALNSARAEEGECRTIWQMVQGLTAYARGFEWVDSRLDLEKRAGKLLDLAKAKANEPVTIAV